MEIGTINLTAIIQAVLTLVAAVVTTFIIPWIRSKTTANQQETIRTVVEFAVAAAEQLYGSGTGQQKKQYVIDYLKKRGYHVDDVVIEGMVYELLNQYKEKEDVEEELVQEVVSDEQAKTIVEKHAEG